MAMATLMLLITLTSFTLLGGLATWDWWLWKNGRLTISDHVTRFFLWKDVPVVVTFSMGTLFGFPFAFVAGLLVGHWLWPNS